jgi:hypothetical protein
MKKYLAIIAALAFCTFGAQAMEAPSRFEGATIKRSEFKECAMAGVSFKRTVLQETKFIETNLKAARFNNCTLEDSLFALCNIVGIVFDNTIPKRTRFVRCFCSPEMAVYLKSIAEHPEAVEIREAIDGAGAPISFIADLKTK